MHRIGRTARGADKGTAITFFTREDDKHANQLCRLLRSSDQAVPDALAAMERKGRGGRGGGKIQVYLGGLDYYVSGNEIEQWISEQDHSVMPIEGREVLVCWWWLVWWLVLF